VGENTGTSASVKVFHLHRWAICLLLLAATVFAAGPHFSSTCSQCEIWNKPQTPFRIFGNTYYVGTHGLSSILITSKDGDILIDGALPQSARPIVANIRSLGFRIQDVKIIVNSHVHFDHAGGIAELQKLSGARVLASAWSAAVMRKGGVGKDDPQYGETQPILPIAHVEELHDGETITLGGIAITAHLTPGHTPGGTSWTWKSCDGSTCRGIIYADSLTPVSRNGYSFSSNPRALQSFEKSFGFLESAPCDVLITVHPDVSRLWDRLDARTRGVTPDPMMNTGACRELAQRAREQLQHRLAAENTKKPN
jgi:metallo-beta-lactamase class B